MAIELGGIVLPELVLSGNFRFGNSGVRSAFNEARDGTPLIFEQSAQYKNADLIGEATAGWITYETLLSLQSIASTSNASYTLSYEGTEYTAYFRNWEQPVIEADPLVPRPNPENGDFFNNVIIKLIILI